MRKIKVSIENIDKIDDVIKEAEGRSRERTIKAKDIILATKDIEHKLGIPKKYMEGVSAQVDINAQEFPKAYKYTPESTHFSIEKGKTAWYLTKVWRGQCKRPSYKNVLVLPDITKSAIIDSMMHFN